MWVVILSIFYKLVYRFVFFVLDFLIVFFNLMLYVLCKRFNFDLCWNFVFFIDFLLLILGVLYIGIGFEWRKVVVFVVFCWIKCFCIIFLGFWRMLFIVFVVFLVKIFCWVLFGVLFMVLLIKISRVFFDVFCEFIFDL